MRELKFRAWFKGEPEPVTYSSDDLFDDTWTDHEVTIVEQFTGLYDRDGREIYEGDIIREEIDTADDLLDGSHECMVVWDKDFLCWGLKGIGFKCDLYEVNRIITIVGNIHEKRR